MRTSASRLLLSLLAVVATSHHLLAVGGTNSAERKHRQSRDLFLRNETASVSAIRRSRAPPGTRPISDAMDSPASPLAEPLPVSRQASLRQFEFLTKTGEFYAGFFLCILSYVPGVGCPLFTGPLDPSVESAASAGGVRVASAVFGGYGGAGGAGGVGGLVYFLQKKLDSEDQDTTVMARVDGPPRGLYLLQLRERGHIGANCSRVGGPFGAVGGERPGELGTLSVDEFGAGLGVFTRRKVPMLGDDSVLGRSVVLVPRSEGGASDSHPLACAVIARF